MYDAITHWGAGIRFPTLCSSLLLPLLIGSSASAVTIEWVPVADAGNTCHDQTQFIAECWGAVPYNYQISKYEITTAQYAEFLNAKAADDPNGLYNEHSAIARSGAPGSYAYRVTAGAENYPIESVSFWDALRFANWMNNGQGAGDTETGAYTLTAQGIAANTIVRNPDATIVLTSVDLLLTFGLLGLAGWRRGRA